jgi:tetratricopeptide (TPR) repeat protein
MATVAEGLLERALALLSSRDPGRLTLLVDLTGAYITSGAFRAARRSNDELLREAVSSGLEDVRWRAMLDKVRLDWYMQSEGTPTVDVAMEAISFFEARGDDQALGMAWRLVASVEMGDGHMANARVAYERAADHAARALDLHGQADARNNIAGVDMIGPATVSAAMRTAVALLDWGRTTGQPVTEAIGLAHLGRLTAMLGDFDEARRLVDAAIEINRDLGQALHEAHSFSRWIGTVEWLAGDPEAAERALRRGYEALGRLGAPGGRAFVGTQLARMLYLLGRYDEAYECTVVAEAYGGVFEIATSVEWRSVRGLVLARRGQADAAVGLAREAVAIIAPTDLLWAHGVALEDLADVLELSGRTFEARPYLAQARALYEQKGITVLAERVRARLEG